MRNDENQLDDEIFLQFETKLKAMKKYLNELITFGSNNSEVKTGTEALKEKMVISFTVSAFNHLQAIRDLLFYPVFPKQGSSEEIKYLPYSSNNHAITIAIISRAILELSAILYWMLKGDEQAISNKLEEYFMYLEFAAAVNIMNMPTLDGQRPSLNDRQREIIKKGKKYCEKWASQKSWKDLTPQDVRGDFYVVIDNEQNLTKMVAEFFTIELEAAIDGAIQSGKAQAVKNKNYFRALYRFLSDIAHSNPFALNTLLSGELDEKNQFNISFDNGNPQILTHALRTSINCYEYVLDTLFSTFKMDKAQKELYNLVNNKFSEL